jgi:hypothetical protein
MSSEQFLVFKKTSDKNMGPYSYQSHKNVQSDQYKLSFSPSRTDQELVVTLITQPQYRSLYIKLGQPMTLFYHLPRNNDLF